MHEYLEVTKSLPWSTIRDMGGTCDRIPSALASLTSTSAEERHSAYWMIDNHVVTQGALYEGAFYTIPFLQCIALSGTGLGEKESVDLLTEIAIGVAGFDSMIRFSVVTEPFVYFIPDENGLAMPLPIACRWGVSMKLPDMIPGLIHHDVETRDRYFDLVDSYSEYAGGIRKIMDGLIDNLRDDMLKRRLYKLYNNLHRR